MLSPRLFHTVPTYATQVTYRLKALFNVINLPWCMGVNKSEVDADLVAGQTSKDHIHLRSALAIHDIS